jgi:uncharacterized membrane protein
MKNITFLMLLLGGLFFAPSNLSATASAVATPTGTEINSTAQFNTESVMKEEKKGGFLQKMMAKKMVKKMKKALGGDGIDGKLIAILAYLFFVGFIVALILHMENKTSLGGFHLAQVLGIIIMAVIGWAFGFIPVIGWIASLVIGICGLINWIVGLINAIKGEEKPVPILGKLFDSSFRDLF